ncbi:MAG TPA: cation transporter, partial [Anaerolineales bacterium]
MNDEKTLVIAIPNLLPGIENNQDGCLERLEKSLQRRAGIHRVHLKIGDTPNGLCLHYDPNLLTGEQVQHLAQQVGATITNRYHHCSIELSGLDCSDCALVIQHSLGRLDGVLEADVQFDTQMMRVEYDSRLTSRRLIERRVEQLGYEVVPHGFAAWYRANWELVFSLASGVALLCGWLINQAPGLPKIAASPFFLLAYILGGYEATHQALHALRSRRLDTHLLMILAALGAAALGDYAEGALLLFLFSLGHSLEERALARARSAVSALANLAPKTALVRRGEVTEILPVEQLVLDDVVIVRPGVRLPVDGAVITGRSAVNQAPVTGESL